MWRDFHGRFNSSSANIYKSEIGSEPDRVCNDLELNTPIHTCFTDATSTPNQLTTAAVCDGYDAMATQSLLTSMAPFTAPRAALIGDHPFDIDRLLVDFDEQCNLECTPQTAPLIDVRMKSPHLLMQLPKVVKPLLLSNTVTPKFSYGKSDILFADFRNQLVLTPALMAQFYRYHAEMMYEYKRYMIFFMQYPTTDDNGFVYTLISCGSNTASYFVLTAHISTYKQQQSLPFTLHHVQLSLNVLRLFEQVFGLERWGRRNTGTGCRHLSPVHSLHHPTLAPAHRAHKWKQLKLELKRYSKRDYDPLVDSVKYGTDPSQRRQTMANLLKTRPKKVDAAFLTGRFKHHGQEVCIICLIQLDGEPYKPACCKRGMCQACTTHLAKEWVHRTSE